MNRELITLKTLEEDIRNLKFKNIFELRLHKDYTSNIFSENIIDIAFGKKTLCISFHAFDKKQLTDEIFNDGLYLYLYDRDGSIINAYEFTKCKLLDIYKPLLAYSDKYSNISVVIKYSDIYKLISTE